MHRRREDHYVPCCIPEVDRSGSRSVWMWAVISHTDRMDLVHVQDNIAEIPRQNHAAAYLIYYAERQRNLLV